MKALFGVEAGAHAGLGHVMRCLPLARELADRGVSTALSLHGDADPDGLPLAGAVTDGTWRHKLGDQGPEADLAAVCRRLRPDWLVADGYRFDTGPLLATQREHGGLLLVMDDLGHDFEADAVCNPNVLTPELYAAKQGLPLVGPRYALVDRAYREYAWNAEDHRQCRRVLVSFGGLDGKNWTGAALAALAALGSPLEAEVVVGPFVPADRVFPERLGDLHVTVRRGLGNLAPYMAEADLMIGAAGSTVWQACAVGTPLISVRVVDNQRFVVQTLEIEQAAVCHQPDQSSPMEQVQALRRSLAQCLDFSVRARLSRHSRSLVDGRGVERLAKFLMRTERS